MGNKIVRLLAVTAMLIFLSGTQALSATLCQTLEEMPQSNDLLLGNIIHVGIEDKIVKLKHFDFANHNISTNLIVLVDWEFAQASKTDTGTELIKLRVGSCERGQLAPISIRQFAGSGVLHMKITLMEDGAGKIRKSNTQKSSIFLP